MVCQVTKACLLCLIPDLAECFIHLTHSIKKHFISTYYGPGFILGSGDTSVEKADLKASAPLKVKVFVTQVVSDSVIPWTVACQPPLSMEFTRQEYQSVLGASVRNSAHGKGHEEGGSAYAKAGSSLRSPPGNSQASTPKPESAYFLLCAFTYTSDFTGGCLPLPLSGKRVSLQLQLIIPGCDSV